MNQVLVSRVQMPGYFGTGGTHVTLGIDKAFLLSPLIADMMPTLGRAGWGGVPAGCFLGLAT